MSTKIQITEFSTEIFPAEKLTEQRNAVASILGGRPPLLVLLPIKIWNGIADCRAEAVADVEKVLQLWRRTIPSDSKGYPLQTEFRAADNIPCSFMWRLMHKYLNGESGLGMRRGAGQTSVNVNPPEKTAPAGWLPYLYVWRLPYRSYKKFPTWPKDRLFGAAEHR